MLVRSVIHIHDAESTASVEGYVYLWVIVKLSVDRIYTSFGRKQWNLIKVLSGYLSGGG